MRYLGLGGVRAAAQTHLYASVMTPDELVQTTSEAISFVHGYLYVIDYEHEAHTALVGSTPPDCVRCM